MGIGNAPHFMFRHCAYALVRLRQESQICCCKHSCKYPQCLFKSIRFVAINTAGKNPDILPKISSGSHLTYVETPPRAVVSHVKAWRWWWWLPNCSKTWNTAKIVWAGKGFKTQIMQSWTIIFNPAALNSYKSAWWVKYLQHRSLKTSNFQRNLSTLWNHCY